VESINLPTLLGILLYAVVLFRWSKKTLSPAFSRYLVLAWVVQWGFALLLYWTFTRYYENRVTADIFKYFDDAGRWFALWQTDAQEAWRIWLGQAPLSKAGEEAIKSMRFWGKVNHYGLYNDNQTMIRLHGLLYFISRGSYGIHQLFFIGLHFFSLAWLFKKLSTTFSKHGQWLLFIVLFGVPSVLFWGAGTTKESLMLTLLAFWLGGMWMWEKHRQRMGLVVMLGSMVGLVFVKMYLLGFLLLALVPWLWNTWRQARRPVLAYLVFYGLLLPSALVLNHRQHASDMTPELWEQYGSRPFCIADSASYRKNALGNGWHFLEKLRFKQQDFVKEAEFEQAGSMRPIPRLNGQATNFFQAIPEGLLIALCAPWPWEIDRVLYLWPFLENLMVWGLWILMLWKYASSRISNHGWFWLFFALSLAAFLGLMTPVLGNLVRYKLPVLWTLLLWPCLFLWEPKNNPG
jgi:hypothetical protein